MAYFSTSSSDYGNAIKNLVKPTYESKYDNTISQLMDKIANREQFSYDFNADPLYQNYKDNYTKLGDEASMNAVANAATMSGGYGNSYGATAASQANQQYLTQLNNVIPELYNAAMNKYKMETEDLYNQFNMYETEESRQYGQHRDSVNDYYSDLSDMRSAYGTALQNEQWQAEMAMNAYQYATTMANDNYWNQKNLDNTNWWNQANYNLKNSQSSSKSSGGPGTKTSEKEQRTVNTTTVSYLTDLLTDINGYADKYKSSDTTAAKRNNRKEERIEQLYNDGKINAADVEYLLKSMGLS